MKRGDIVTIAVSGDYEKPRPALVIQADGLDETDSVLICQMSSTPRDAPLYRLKILASEETGLRDVSYIMGEKILAVRRTRCGAVIGRLPSSSTADLNRMLSVIIGLAG